MIKEGRLVKERGLNSNYYEVVSVEGDNLQLKLDKGILHCNTCNYEEVTNGRVDWSKVPVGTTIYYFSNVDYSWVESEFLEYRLGTKDGWLDGTDYIIRRDKSSNDDLVLICKDAYIMDDWLENEIRMYQEDVDPKNSDKGTEELEKCLKYIENMTTEEYSELYNRVLEANTSNVFRDPTDEDIKEEDLLNKTIKKHLKDRNNPNWRLPTKDELNLMFVLLHKNNIGGFIRDNSYWSSSEDNNNNAWLQGFRYGFQYNIDKNINSYHIRAIRAFKSNIDYKIGDNTGTGFIFSKEHHREGYKPYYQYKECAKEDFPNKLTWDDAMNYFNKGDAKVFSDKEIDDSVNKNQLNDTKKYNERDMLKDTYNFLERFLECHKADNQYFNKLDMLYNFAKIGLKSIDKM